MTEPIRILYVDDVQFDRELVRLALADGPGQFELTEASRREDFLRHLEEGCYSLVLSDLNILGFSGLEALQHVKSKHPDLPVVILTGTGSEELAVAAMKGGAADYVIKNAHHLRRLPLTLTAILESEQLRRDKLAAEKELQETRLALAQAQKMEALGRLAGGVAHDLNNLLTVMIGYGSAIQEALPQSEEVMEMLRAVSAASRMTWQLLAISRRQVQTMHLLDLNAVILGLRGMLERLLPADVRLVLELAPQLPLVEADQGQLEQVIINLVLNARDAQPQGGQIYLRTTHQNHQHRLVKFEVTDCGPGLAPDVMDRIFEPFFTTKANGTGLGLATVYGIVYQNGGEVRVESQQGEGATFIVTLPAAIGRPAAPATEPPVEKTAATPGRRRVLVVEDNEAIRKLVVLILRRQGYQVSEASSGDQALQTAERDFDLLVTDIILPGISGLELAEKLQAPKVLFTSGCNDVDLQQRGYTPDLANFLPKPFSPGQLQEKVHAMLA